MFTKIRMAVTAALLTASMFFVTASPAAATGYTGILAGRPINGNASQTCQGTAYGKVGGVLVLFTAWHCRGPAADGSAAYGPNGQVIGSYGYLHQGNSHDLDYIVIQAYDHPTTGLNTIYRGNPGYTPYYWTITSQPYQNHLTCNELEATVAWGTGVYQNFQSTNLSAFPFRSGTTVWWQDFHSDDHYPWVACTVKVTQTVQTAYKDSGSSFILQGYATVFGIASSSWYTSDGVQHLLITPMSEGLLALNYQTATSLCTTSTC